jgi:hypothetical protein
VDRKKLQTPYDDLTSDQLLQLEDLVKNFISNVRAANIDNDVADDGTWKPRKQQQAMTSILMDLAVELERKLGLSRSQAISDSAFAAY